MRKIALFILILLFVVALSHRRRGKRGRKGRRGKRRRRRGRPFLATNRRGRRGRGRGRGRRRRHHHFHHFNGGFGRPLFFTNRGRGRRGRGRRSRGRRGKRRRGRRGSLPVIVRNGGRRIDIQAIRRRNRRRRRRARRRARARRFRRANRGRGLRSRGNFNRRWKRRVRASRIRALTNSERLRLWRLRFRNRNGRTRAQRVKYFRNIRNRIRARNRRLNNFNNIGTTNPLFQNTFNNNFGGTTGTPCSCQCFCHNSLSTGFPNTGLNNGDQVTIVSCNGESRNFEYYAENGEQRYFRAVGTQKTWRQANKYCNTFEGGRLAIPTTQGLQNKVQDLLNGRVGWIGLRLVPNSVNGLGSIWVNSNYKQHLADFYWESNQLSTTIPENRICTEMSANGYWNDRDCRQKLPFVCEIVVSSNPPLCPTNNGYQISNDAFGNQHCLKYFSNVQLPWLNALEYCNHEGGELVLIKDSVLNSHVANVLTSPNVGWIGVNSLNDDRIFAGVDDYPISYYNWVNGGNQPSGVGNCVFINSNGFWNTANCATNRQFVCDII